MFLQDSLRPSPGAAKTSPPTIPPISPPLFFVQERITFVREVFFLFAPPIIARSLRPSPCELLYTCVYLNSLPSEGVCVIAFFSTPNLGAMLFPHTPAGVPSQPIARVLSKSTPRLFPYPDSEGKSERSFRLMYRPFLATHDDPFKRDPRPFFFFLLSPSQPPPLLYES